MRKHRAVAVIRDGSAFLLMRRHRNGLDYHVLPGGGVEPGETPADACLREIFEETTLTARIDRELWTLRHQDREATYFLLTDVRGQPRLSGPEAEKNSPQNSYLPVWVDRTDLESVNLQPAELLPLLLDLH